MKTNTKAKDPVVLNHEGAKAVFRENTVEKLRRSLQCCMLWEDSFYEDGKSIAERIKGYVINCSSEELSEVVRETRASGIRHAPLLVLREMMRFPKFSQTVSELIPVVCDRPDQLIELLSIYWLDRFQNKKRIPYSFVKGAREAFKKFNSYSLAKYKNEDKLIKLRDVVRLVHPKPVSEEQSVAFKQLLSGELKRTDTWEDRLSAGGDKAEVFSSLISEGKLGGLALIRNLRNMMESGVNPELVRSAISKMNTDRIEPFRILKAADHAPRYTRELEERLFESCKKMTRIKGHTAILVDVSGSMSDPISNKSELKRSEAGFGLAVILKEVCEESTVFAFGNDSVALPHLRGFALYERGKNPNGGTDINRSLKTALREVESMGIKSTNVIIITDLQSQTNLKVSPSSFGGKGFFLNIGVYEPTIVHGEWEEMTGFSERVIEYVAKQWSDER